MQGLNSHTGEFSGGRGLGFVTETTNWCEIKRLPAMDVKHHVIQFEGAISPQSVGIVHHMEVVDNN